MQNQQVALLQQPTPTTCFNRIKLNKGIAVRNFIGCLCHYFILSFVFVSIDSLQPMLLQQKFNIEREHSLHNYLNSLVIAFDIITKVVTAPLFGYFADRIGRKMINTYGILVITISMCVMPFCGQFYQYCLMRVFYATGAIAISVVPLLADYVSNESKGTCSAVLVFMSSLGALTSAQMSFNILKRTIDSKIYVQYLTAATITAVIGFTYSLICLKSGNTYYLSDQPKQPRSCLKMIQVGKQSLKSPQLTLSYMSAFLARSDSILLSLFMVLWAYSFEPDDYNSAYMKASAYSGVSYAVIMFSCIVYGILLQRKKSTKLMFVAMLSFAAIGTLMINFITTMGSFILYIALGVLGLGMSGLLTSSLFLVNSYAPQQHRGYVTGIQTLVGILGITVQTFIGSLLLDKTGRNGPFNLFGGICVVMIPIALVVYRNKKSLDTQPEPQYKSSLMQSDVN